MYVLDTNTLIYFFKGLGRIGENLLSVAISEVVVPSVVLYEVLVGIEKSSSPEKRRTQLQEFVSLVKIAPFGSTEASEAAQIRAKLEKKGTPIGPYDILIAATTMARHATLVTHNKKEFGRIKGLRIIDWY